MTDKKAATKEQVERWGRNELDIWTTPTSHADFIDTLVARIREQQATIERLRGLLKVARCPDTDCVDGAVPCALDPEGRHWEATQCQWCDERRAMLEVSDEYRAEALADEVGCVVRAALEGDEPFEITEEPFDKERADELRTIIQPEVK